MAEEFLGYKRADGSVGIRNKLLVLATVDCGYQVACRIADAIPGAIALTHPYGCGRDSDIENQMIGIATHPNVAAVLLVGHGCGTLTVDVLKPRIEESGKSVASVVVQKDGGSLRTIEKGTRLLRDMAIETSKLRKETFNVKNLTVAVECGGSDSTSGLAANPAVGNTIDRLIDAGGTAIFTEPLEMLGTEHILARRAVNEEVKDEIYALVHRAEVWAKARGVKGRFMSKGNMDGGLTTIEEKALGAVLKGGTRKIQGVLKNGKGRFDKPTRTGLYLQDGTGFDIPSITHMVAAGSQIAFFTTGRGAIPGNAIAPVIKVTGNPLTYENMKDNMDVNAGLIVEGKTGVTAIGKEMFDLILRVASGEKTKAELLGYNDFAIWRRDPVAENLLRKIPEEEL